jgi:hypothetical protein
VYLRIIKRRTLFEVEKELFVLHSSYYVLLIGGSLLLPTFQENDVEFQNMETVIDLPYKYVPE